MKDSGWTLDELVARVAATLGETRPGQPSRRVREVPDRRAIRWYTTIGLLDRPQLRGRTGWYGPRHVLQLVAIKRLQAAGKPLAEIQAELAGAGDATLREIAQLPDEPAAPVARRRTGGRAKRFWTAPPAPEGDTGIRYAVELAEGVTLLVRDAPEDLSAVREAARPLLDLLARSGAVVAAPDHQGDS